MRVLLFSTTVGFSSLLKKYHSKSYSIEELKKESAAKNQNNTKKKISHKMLGYYNFIFSRDSIEIWHKSITKYHSII